MSGQFERDFASYIEPQAALTSAERLAARYAAEWATNNERERALRIVREQKQAANTAIGDILFGEVERRLKGDDK